MTHFNSCGVVYHHKHPSDQNLPWRLGSVCSAHDMLLTWPWMNLLPSKLEKDLCLTMPPDVT